MKKYLIKATWYNEFEIEADNEEDAIKKAFDNKEFDSAMIGADLEYDVESLDDPEEEYRTIYLVISDTDDNNVRKEFDNEEDALNYAYDSDDAIVYKITLNSDDDEIDEEEIWNYTEADLEN